MWIKNIHDRSPFPPFIHALFWLLSGNKVKFPISEGNLNFLLCSEKFRRNLCWRHCKYKEWVSFFLGSWEMNRSAEHASRFTRFVCSALRFISHEPRKKDTHSLNELHRKEKQIFINRLRGAFKLLFFPMQFIWPVRTPTKCDSMLK